MRQRVRNEGRGGRGAFVKAIEMDVFNSINQRRALGISKGE